MGIFSAWFCLGCLSVADYRVELVCGDVRGDSRPLAGIQQPFGCEFDATGGMWFVEFTDNRLRLRTPDGGVSIKAGTGRKGWSGDGGPGLQATFNGIHNLAVGADGMIYLADTFNNRVRKYDPKTGVVSTFAGTGERGYYGDGGPAIKAQLGGPHCVTFDPTRKRLYIADLENRRIRAIEMATGVIELIAGSGFRALPNDGGNAQRQPLIDPRAVAVDAIGNVFIVERTGNAIRQVSPDGKIRTIAGTGRKGNSVADGPALEATFNGPKHACVDGEGNLLIADTENHAIRKLIVREGKLVRIAGTGRKGSSGIGGPALELELRQPHGVTVHKDGSIYIADSGNHRILRLVQ